MLIGTICGGRSCFWVLLSSSSHYHSGSRLGVPDFWELSYRGSLILVQGLCLHTRPLEALIRLPRVNGVAMAMTEWPCNRDPAVPFKAPQMPMAALMRTSLLEARAFFSAHRLGNEAVSSPYRGQAHSVLERAQGGWLPAHSVMVMEIADMVVILIIIVIVWWLELSVYAVMNPLLELQHTTAMAGRAN